MLLTALPLLAAFVTATERPAATTSNNITFYGGHKQRVESFLGIRFAHDTSGSRRFKPPIKFEYLPGSDVYATRIGPACPQPPNPNISEDCLRLNVFRPNGTTSTSKLPVMVYLHGGSFVAGSKDDPMTQPGGLILQSVQNGHSVMHVSMNYRLGVFGFAQSHALKKERSENAGLRDQRLASEWVMENIRAFGGDSSPSNPESESIGDADGNRLGDPDNVTIHGQSSGGLSVGMQILAFGGAKSQLFHRGIAQSQALENGITGNFTRNPMQKVADGTGCNTTDLQSADTITCLRKLSMDELLRAENNSLGASPGDNLGDEWLPVVDGDFLPAAPSNLIATGQFYNISMIAGWCQDDANQFVDFFRAYLPGFTTENLDNLLALYPISELQAAYFPNGSLEQPSELCRAGRIVRDILFVCQAVNLGAGLHKAGNKVYFYDQNQTMLTPLLESEGQYGYGVVHTSELAYVFGNLSYYEFPGIPYHPTTSDFALRDRESRTWSSFARREHGIYVIGGPNEGYAGLTDGNPASQRAVSGQRIRERCAFLNSPEIVRQQLY
ncbi:hypothetical protein M409DRAFT_66636 [Zasmidium cellare ATCC 36951]|uniref:Carboxylesterase type B domain-containing protein n=1 Tax=Zasmidium cellare ATCC 36951 TaxID=1080233 RepID=A0A6A6CJ83_ZASCE|nr:uncharacterized protein M409DRAFT_66636 [Zasmidium cellare ATCC 36951]KAF2166663.1 hypothetical protein M409DRAFT_66636 [Zasmidium cellare ATCC 36951]